MSSTAGDSSSASSGITRISFTCVPHHHAMTKAGDATLSKFKDALAEFIDNSIEATWKAGEAGLLSEGQERRVEINVFCDSLNASSTSTIPPSYLTIADNGCGMTENELVEFSTYALNKSERNQKILAENTSCIGRFGVGSKQSGYWLGDRIRVICKGAPPPAAQGGEEAPIVDVDDGTDCVYEVTHDCIEMERKAAVAKEEVYKGEIIRRPRGKSNHDGVPKDEAANKSLMELIEKHERENKYFTLFIVKLKREKAEEFFKETSTRCNFYQYPTELAQIYHFHLHPEHTPAKICDLPKFDYRKKTKEQQSYDRVMYPTAPKVSGQRGEKPKKVAPLNITFSIFQKKKGALEWKGVKDYTNLSLRDVRDAVTQHFDKAAACFRFSMLIPKPDPPAVTTSQAIKNLEIDDRANAGNMAEVQGLVFYFPYAQGSETRPLPSYHDNSWYELQQSNIASSSLLSPHESQTKPPTGSRAGQAEEEDEEFEEDEVIIVGDDDDDDEGDGAQVDDDDDDDDGAQAVGGSASKRRSLSSSRGKGARKSDGNDSSMDLEEPEAHRRVVTPDSSELMSATERNELLKRPEQSLFDVYWSERLLPQSHANTIAKLFPNITTIGDCEKHELPENWRQRLKGYLFFDNSWHAVTNNKLALRIPQYDLDTYFAPAHIANDISIDKTTKENFRKFLQNCHKHFDREFTCKERMRDFESVVQGGKHAAGSLALFRKAVWGGDAGIEVKAGDVVKIFLTSTGRRTSNASGKAVLGKIVCFSVVNQTTTKQEHFLGAPVVHYLRMPTVDYHGEEAAFFKDGNPEKPTEAAFNANEPCSIQAIFHPKINYAVEKSKGRQSSIFATEREVAAVRSQGLHKISLCLFEKKGGRPTFVSDSMTFQPNNRKFYKFCVQLLNKSDSPIISSPAPHITSNKSKFDNFFRVRTMYMPNGVRTEEKTERDLWVYNASENKDERKGPSYNLNLVNAYFTTYGLRDGLADSQDIELNYGENKYKVEVLDSRDRVVMRKEFVLKVHSSLVHSWKVELLDHNPRTMASYLPRMRLTLLDKHKEIARDAKCKIKVVISFASKPTAGGKDESDDGVVSKKKQKQGRRGADEMEIEDKTDEPDPDVLAVRCFCFSNSGEPTEPLRFVSSVCEFEIDPTDRGELLIGPVEEGHNEYRIDMKDSADRVFQVRGCEPGGLWSPAFPTDGTFCEAPNFLRDGKVTQFTMVVTLEEGGQTEDNKLGKDHPQTFRVEYHSTHKIAELRRVTSGATRSSKEKEDSGAGVMQGEPIPELVFQCYDRFGMKVAPGFRDVTRKWTFRVDSPYVEGDLVAEANPQGEVVFRHLRVKEDLGDAEAPKITGLPVEILVSLVVNENERLREPWTVAHMDEQGFNTENFKCIWEPKDTLLDYLEDGSNEDPKKVLKAYRKYSEKERPPHLKVPIVVLPRCKPTFIKVFFDGREVDEAELESLTVGAELSNLTLRLYDSNNEQIPFEKSWFPAKKKNLIDVSWDQDFKSFKWSESSALELKLPDITSDMTSAPGVYDMHVILHIFDSLEFEFEINVLAGEPTRWGLLTSADCESEGVRCDDPEDFASKILAVVLADDEGYTVPRSAIANDLQPVIQIFDRDPSRLVEEDAESDGGDAASKKKKKKQKQGRRAVEEMETEEVGGVEEVVDDDDDDDDEDEDEDEDENEDSDEEGASSRKRKRTVRAPAQSKVERIMPNPIDTLEASLYVPSKGSLSGGVAGVARGGGSQGRQEGCFYFSSATDLPYPVQPHIGDEPERYVWIVVTDKGQRLKPFVKKIEITYGLPASMQVRCKAFCISNWTATDAVAKINRQATNTVFEVKLLDENGHPAVAYPNSKKMKNFEVKVLSPGKPGVEILKRSFSAPGEFFAKSLSIKGVLKALSAMAPGAPATALTSTGPTAGKNTRSKPRKGQAVDDDAMHVDGSTAAAAAADEACEIKVLCSYKFRDVEHKLKPIVLKCETSQLNNVTSIRIAADADDGEEEESSPSDKLVVPCDKSPGDLAITLVTDDGVPLSASELVKTVEARLVKELFYSEKQAGANNKRKMCSYGDYFYFPTVNSERRAIIMRGQTQDPSELGDSQALWKVGFYTLVLQYKELREFEGFEGVVFPDVSESFTFQVVPGRVHSLYPDQKSYQKLSKCSATSTGDNRVITNGVYIYGRDCWGNQTNLPEGTTVSCKIRRSVTSMLTQEVDNENSHPGNSGYTPGSLPHLKGADSQGFLSSTVTSQGRAAFDLELEEGTGSSPGIMELVFDFVDASFDHPVKQHVATFKFTTDAKRIKAEKKLRADLHALEEKKKVYDDNREELENAKETATNNITKMLQLSKSVYLSNMRNMAMGGDENDISAEDIKKQKKQIATTIKDREKAPVRPAKIDASEQRALERQVNLANEHDVETLGHIIDLGYVEDEEDAIIMSQIASGFMHMLVVPDREKCYELAKMKDSQGKPLSVWPLGDCPRFAYNGPDSTQKNRSEEDRKKKKLPARELKADDGKPIPGRPRALVNVVQLVDEHEDLRETVFNSIFGTTVIFDDLESALKYKQRTLKIHPKRTVPTLWAKKEGQRVASDGRIDGRNAIKASDASRLKFVFGSLPSSKNAEFSGLKHDLLLCDDLIEEIKNRDAAEAQIRALPRNDIDELIQGIANVKYELDKLEKSDSD